MLLFWSEEHIEKWCRDWQLPVGAVIPLDTCWQLARRWYSADRRHPDWRRPTVDETEAILAELGLAGPFWQLRGG